MISPIQFALVTAAAALPLGPTVARSTPAADVAHHAAAPATAPDSARIQGLLKDADALELAGRFGEARRRYRSLADELRASDQYSAETLWRLANNYYDHDDEMRSAAVLDELAEAAARFGDPTMELRATFEAAVIYQRHRDRGRVAPKIVRVKALLQSPAIADATKREVEARLGHG